jgi:hypothetical protein
MADAAEVVITGGHLNYSRPARRVAICEIGTASSCTPKPQSREEGPWINRQTILDPGAEFYALVVSFGCSGKLSCHFQRRNGHKPMSL